MSPLNRRYTLEALIAASILALLLMLMMPRFFAAQKYGPIGPEDCEYISGNWFWNKGILYQDTLPMAGVHEFVIKHDYTRANLSFKVFIPIIEKKMEGIELICFNDSESYEIGTYMKLSTEEWHEIRFEVNSDKTTIYAYLDGQIYSASQMTIPFRFKIQFYNTKGFIRDIKISHI